MAKPKARAPFEGLWHIVSMDTWDEDYFNEEVQAFIEFEAGGIGNFQFGYVSGYMDWRATTRDGEPAVGPRADPQVVLAAPVDQVVARAGSLAAGVVGHLIGIESCGLEHGLGGFVEARAEVGIGRGEGAAAHHEKAGVKIDMRPLEGNQLADAETVPIANQDERPVALGVAAAVIRASTSR